MLSIIERARNYIAKMDPAIAGSGGHDATFKVAMALVAGFGLSEDEALPLMMEYSATCSPPWSESDLRHKLKSANEKAGERGYLLEDQKKKYESGLHEFAEIRGFSIEAMRALGAEREEWRIWFPMRECTADGGCATTGRRMRRRDTKPFKNGSKELGERGSRLGLFMPWPIPEGDLLIVEGLPDTLRGLTAGHGATLGTPGAKPGKRVLESLQKIASGQSGSNGQGRKVILAPHPDEAGRDWLQLVGRYLANGGCNVFYIPAGDKDLDDRLKGERNQKEALISLMATAVRWVDQKDRPEAIETNDQNGIKLTREQLEGLTKFNLTDDGNARAIVYLFGDNIRYVYDAEVWRIWNGRRWQDDLQGAVERAAVKSAKAICRAGYESATLDSDQKSRLISWGLRSEGQGKVVAALDALRRQPEITTLRANWDAEPWLLGLPEGAIDLRSGEYLTPDPKRLISKSAGCRLDAGATCPRTDAFLFEICGGDESLVAFLQRAIGYALTGSTQEQVFFICHGEGSNGKSVFFKMIGWLLGDYGRAADFESFVPQKYSRAIRDDLARLEGCRFVSAKESEQQKRLDEATIKKLTGGDVITASKKYVNEFEFEPIFKLWLGVNHKPKILGGDKGIWRRVRMIPFNEQFEPNAEPRLEEVLEREIPGLLRLAIGWCREWIADNLGWPAQVLEATEEYRRDQDVLAPWIEECCIVDKENKDCMCLFSELYKAYQKWAEKEGLKDKEQLSNRMFVEKLEEKGFKKHRGTAGAVWRKGINLKDQPEQSQIF